MRKHRVPLLVLLVLLITVVGMSGQRAEAPPPPPFPIEQCDNWLRKAASRWTNALATSDASIATACYLSHLVRR